MAEFDEPSLAQTEELFWQLISAPEGAAAGIAALAPAAGAVASALVRGDPRLSAVERLDVYANMYFFRLLDVLKEDFPALSALVGETSFHNLITDYLLVHPSSHFSLRFVGQHLPAFVEGHALRQQWPFVGALARFEWTLLDVFDVVDVAPLAVEELARIAAEQWSELRLELSPSLRLLESEWPLAELWRAYKGLGERESASGRAASRYFRIWRQDFQVWHREIDPDEFRALEAFGSGATFGEVCEQLAGESGGEEAAAQRALALLRTWFADSLLTGLR